MKKLLQLLSASFLVTSSISYVVACGNNTPPAVSKIDLSKLHFDENTAKIYYNANSPEVITYYQYINTLVNKFFKTNLTLNKDIIVKFFKDKNTKIEITDLSKFINSNIYVKVYANKHSSKVKTTSQSGSLKFYDRSNQATDQEFSDAVAQDLANLAQENKLNMEIPDANGLQEQTIESNLKAHINTPSFSNPYIVGTNFDKNKVAFNFNDQKQVYYQNEQLVGTVHYNNDATGSAQFAFWIQKSTGYIIAEKIAKASQVPLKFRDQDNITINLIATKIESLVKDIVTNNYKIINGTITHSIHSGQVLQDGEYTCQVMDNNNNLLVNPDTKGNEFQFQFTTNTLEAYEELKSKLDQISSPSIMMENMPLLSFLPSLIIDNLNGADKVKALLSQFTLKDFVDTFVNPNGVYARLLPRVMPTLNSHGIAKGKNQNIQYWNFINTVQSYLEKYQISQSDLINKGNQQGWTILKIGDHTTYLKYNLFDLLKNIMPDLIHLHNYILNQTQNTSNYLLMFLQYLNDTPKNYAVTTTTNDGFEDIASGNKTTGSLLERNFDDLLHNILFSFTSKSTNYNSGLRPLIFEPHIGPFNIDIDSWKLISYDGSEPGVHFKRADPYEEVFKNPLNQIIKAQGFNINDNIMFNYRVCFTWQGMLKEQSISDPVNLASFYISELQTLFKKLGADNNFIKNNDITINSGLLHIEIMKKGSDQWVVAQNADEVLAPDIINMRFDFSNIKFTLTDNLNPTLQFIYTLKNFYLNW